METWLLSLLVASLSLNTNSATDQPVNFSLIVSSAATINRSGIISGVDRALELINSNITILPGCQLQYTQVLDTQCDNRSGVLNLLREITSNESAIVGCGCSLATEEIANIIDIPVISYASTSVALSDRSVYPNVVRTVPSDESLAPALATVMQYYGWRTLSILTEQEIQFIELLRLLDTSLMAASISVENSVQFNTGNLSETADRIFDGDSRIIMLNTNPKSAVFYLCRAFKEERFYPGYVWITPGWYQQGWWKVDENYIRSLNCTSSDIEQQLDRSLVLLAHPSTSSENITEIYNSTSYAMDAVMTLALALNKNSTLNLNLWTDDIEAVAFNGASGIVQFDSNGNRLNPIVLLLQFRMDTNIDDSTTLHLIARIMDTVVTYVNWENNSTIWPDRRGFPPIISVINTTKTSVHAYVVTVVTTGVLLSIAYLLFNVIFRSRKIVKLTSPNLGYVMVLGSTLLSLGSLFMTGAQLRNKEMIAILCIFERTFQPIGYDICFVVALVKTARVVYLFRKVSPSKKKVRDWHLLLLTAGIVMIDVLFLIPLDIVNYVMGGARLETDNEKPSFKNEHGYTVVNYIISCDRSLTYILPFSLTIMYKVIIHIIGLVLAFLTRKVKIDSLNESKYSTAIIYCSCFLLLLAIIANFAVPGINRMAIAWTTVVFIEVCMFLGLTFIPKMVLLYKDPQGEKIFNGTGQSSSKTPGTMEYPKAQFK